MDIHGVPCTVAALSEEERIVEIRLESDQEKSILGNIYTGQVENIASNIQAAFVQIEPGKRCYYSLAEAQRAVFSAGRKGNGPLRPGDELLVQVSRDAMKGKLPALTSNLNFTGRYLVLTTGDKKFGLSSKLALEDRHRLSGWLKEEAERPDKEFGIIVRTNAADASKEEILASLKAQQATAKPVEGFEAMLALSDYDYLESLEAFQKGWIQVQDISSALVGELAAPKKDSYVMDVCAAPGGKSLHIADKLQGTGCVEARDLTYQKVALIEENASRMGTVNVKAVQWDATEFDPASENKADLVIADLPCSGLGIIGKKTRY